ncbi:hypothetical protein [Neorhizobium galegae]|uniref:hypothetical protein n=1 Tax=Neorhizobium galegae TaxID=399 RepID=UPI000622420C|nr:hypothetical protein [Neorhizobium galegae]CDZ60892.1 Hypothetical protein NGAL_HAMBI2566_42260 [Neorhizobium galegae bv. orientalis]KAB1126569.1 hypothetical protein F4V90_05565 [Neorhizobium galegae]MCQ1808222.1 hypothetical protein [Neorhizobium galegae]MCQ1833890.1 hypothetical protein [Neorhizobium galegae]UIK06555.1 hypothetical protein LZK81_06130 [Neorhizobium galegae]
MTDLKGKALPTSRVTFLAFLLAWAALWSAWLSVTITRSYIHYGDVIFGATMWLLPLFVVPLILGLPVIATLGLERFGVLHGVASTTIVGGCISALQALLVLQAYGNDAVFMDYSRLLIVSSNFIPGVVWGIIYSWLARRSRK